MSIVTKTGDKGVTGLLYGGRVPKDDPRVEAYGTVDEAVSAMGLARSLSAYQEVKDILLATQKGMFAVGAELATDIHQYEKFDAHFKRVTSAQVEQLEQIIKDIEAKLNMPPTFIAPGATPGAAALDLARTIVRRAERRAVDLQRSGMLTNTEIIRYLNRLSDMVYTLARYETRETGPEVLVGRGA